MVTQQEEVLSLKQLELELIDLAKLTIYPLFLVALCGGDFLLALLDPRGGGLDPRHFLEESVLPDFLQAAFQLVVIDFWVGLDCVEEGFNVFV